MQILKMMLLILLVLPFYAHGGTAIRAKPSMSLTPAAVKHFNYSWNDIEGETSRKLPEKPNKKSSGDETDSSARFAGAVYVYARSDDVWSQQAYIKASNTDTADFFGSSIALSTNGNTLIIGAVGEDSNAIGIDGDKTDNSASAAGAVYICTGNYDANTIKAQVLSSLNQARGELVTYRDQHIQDFPKEVDKATAQLVMLGRVITNVELMNSEELKKATLQTPKNLAEGFDEQYYLEQNPNVADAISKGDWGSGFEHFGQYGYKEGRKGSADSLPYLTPTMESLGSDLHDVSNNVIDGRLDRLINSKNMITTAFRNPELSEQDAKQLTFAPVEGSLFVDGVSANDVKHGFAGNTMVTALLASIAEQNPQLIEDLITDHGDGTYTVHFKGVGDVIVDGTLPTLDGQPVFAHVPNGELWVAIIEKAYAQGKGEDGVGYDATRDTNKNPDGSIQRLRLQQDILGGPDSAFYGQKPLRYVTPEELQANLESGIPIIAVAQGDRRDTSHMSDEVYDYGLAPGHAYSVIDTRIGENRQTEVRLYNPWGRIEPGVGLGADENAVATDGRHDGAFWINWEDFNTYFSTVTGLRSEQSK